MMSEKVVILSFLKYYSSIHMGGTKENHQNLRSIPVQNFNLYIEMDYDFFLPHPSQFLIHNQPNFLFSMK